MGSSMNINLNELKISLDGDLLTDKLSRIIYSTDASVYKEEPLAVVLPKHKQDIITIVMPIEQMSVVWWVIILVVRTQSYMVIPDNM